MSNIVSYRALIRGIEKVYFKVSLVILHRRMDSYHTIATHQEHARDIKSPLQDCVDIIIGYALDNPKVIYRIDQSIDKHTTIHLSEHKNNLAAHLYCQPDHEHLSDLSRYFKARSAGFELYPCIQEKLEHSIWDHIHSTLRCARLGDQRCSKMHADIASHACKELAHYLNEEDYQTFTDEVEDHLNILKSDQPDKTL
ncbi:MAG: hypothetical protein OQK32_06825 [Gammaproteobacteria bacterium]|nr:hypothetical protein [Gammaproteobacteria bacterium]MCW8923122.1 hypothetical protein [Gammaproteobacteria bacterium]